MENLRNEFVSEALNCTNFSSLCREFNITRKTGYKWLERYVNGETMQDKSRCPISTPSKTPPEIENLIITIRLNNPGWGAKTIKYFLENQGFYDIPSSKTVNNILHRYNLISHEESLKHKPTLRFEKEHCNDMWQTDFKGEFLTMDNKYCFPLTIIDDHSRFSIKIVPSLSTANIVIPSFKLAFQEFGMPNSILSDNGAQFAGFRQGFTKFEKWLMDLDILPIHGRCKHPQTQGKIERFHRTMKEELIKHSSFTDLNDANIKLQQWRDKYNNFRPHEALSMHCPADVYVPSNRQYTDTINKFDYSGLFHVIKVNSWGYVRFNNWQVYLSETMADQYLEFRNNDANDSFIACYRNFKIAEFSNKDGKLLNRKISRL